MGIKIALFFTRHLITIFLGLHALSPSYAQEKNTKLPVTLCSDSIRFLTEPPTETYRMPEGRYYNVRLLVTEWRTWAKRLSVQELSHMIEQGGVTDSAAYFTVQDEKYSYVEAELKSIHDDIEKFKRARIYPIEPLARALHDETLKLIRIKYYAAQSNSLGASHLLELDPPPFKLRPSSSGRKIIHASVGSFSTQLYVTDLTSQSQITLQDPEWVDRNNRATVLNGNPVSQTKGIGWHTDAYLFSEDEGLVFGILADDQFPSIDVWNSESGEHLETKGLSVSFKDPIIFERSSRNAEIILISPHKIQLLRWNNKTQKLVETQDRKPKGRFAVTAASVSNGELHLLQRNGKASSLDLESLTETEAAILKTQPEWGKARHITRVGTSDTYAILFQRHYALYDSKTGLLKSENSLIGLQLDANSVKETDGSEYITATSSSPNGEYIFVGTKMGKRAVIKTENSELFIIDDSIYPTTEHHSNIASRQRTGVRFIGLTPGNLLISHSLRDFVTMREPLSLLLSSVEQRKEALVSIQAQNTESLHITNAAESKTAALAEKIESLLQAPPPRSEKDLRELLEVLSLVSPDLTEKVEQITQAGIRLGIGNRSATQFFSFSDMLSSEPAVATAISIGHQENRPIFAMVHEIHHAIIPEHLRYQLPENPSRFDVEVEYKDFVIRNQAHAIQSEFELEKRFIQLGVSPNLVANLGKGKDIPQEEERMIRLMRESLEKGGLSSLTEFIRKYFDHSFFESTKNEYEEQLPDALKELKGQ